MSAEVLAPVGSLPMLQAAVRAGADAVYLGYGQFHARQGADNFEDTALSEVVSYCHVRGVKVYLTLNTLVRDEEIEQALGEIREACAAGVDALIVQDLGLARLCRAAAPQMPLHASTQLSCHTPEGVRELVRHGFCRVVLAREMTAEEITACAGLGAELEVFVHGALCMSVSGQCYLSAMIGGRSGNRGRCAQACRLPFSPSPDKGKPNEEACLSLRDLSLVEHLPELVRPGVCSLKIEGRRKRPEYVAAAVAAVRRAVEELPPDPQLTEDLRAVFSRTGFTDGYYTGHRDSTLFGVRRKEDVVAAEPVLKRLRGLYHKEIPHTPIDLYLTVRKDTPVRLCVEDRDGHRVECYGEPPLPSDKSTDSARLCEHLSKTGGTPFIADLCTAGTDDCVYLPLAQLNALRRQALEKLEALRRTVQPIPFTMPARTPLEPPASAAAPRRLVRLADAAQMSEAVAEMADTVLFPLHTDGAVLRHWSCRTKVGVEIPRALFGRENAVREALTNAKSAGATAALCGNIGALPLCREAGLRPIGNFSLNITNAEALAACREAGLEEAVLSFELTFPQMRFARVSGIDAGIVVYGRLPLMLMRPCPRKAAAGCGGCAQKGSLTDRTGTVFPLVCGEGYTELLNSVPLYFADRLEELPKLPFWMLFFTTETPQEVAQIVAAYQTGASAPPKITRGLYRRGVE